MPTPAFKSRCGSLVNTYSAAKASLSLAGLQGLVLFRLRGHQAGFCQSADCDTPFPLCHFMSELACPSLGNRLAFRLGMLPQRFVHPAGLLTVTGSVQARVLIWFGDGTLVCLLGWTTPDQKPPTTLLHNRSCSACSIDPTEIYGVQFRAGSLEHACH